MSPSNVLRHSFLSFFLNKVQKLTQHQQASPLQQEEQGVFRTAYEQPDYETSSDDDNVIVIHDTTNSALLPSSPQQTSDLDGLLAAGTSAKAAVTSSPLLFNDVNDYDTRPIDLQDFIESASAANGVSRTFLEYVTAATTTTTETRNTTGISGIGLSNFFSPTTLSSLAASSSFQPSSLPSSSSSLSAASSSSSASSETSSSSLSPFASIFGMEYFDSASSSTTMSNLQRVLSFDKQLSNLSWYGMYDNSTQITYDPEWEYRTCIEVYNPDLDANRVEFWVCGVMLNIVGILGIIGNIISMIILSRPQMRSSINYLLIGLARCDTVLIITSMVLFGIPSIYPYTGYFFFYYNYIYPFISPGVYPIAMIVQTASIYMTFTVTLERYVAVCHPLKARALCTYGRARIYFIVCFVFSLLYNLPRFWEVLTVTYQPLPDSNALHCVRPSLLRRDPTYKHIYIHWCYLIVNYIIPFLTLAILNCLIYRQVKRANHERQRLSRSEKREIGLATMLLCVVMVFFVLNLPALILNISETFYDIIDPSLAKISNLLVTINSSCNFLIYVIFGEKFKRIFLLIFFKRRLSRDQPDLIHYESSISNNGDGTINHRSSGRFSRHGTQRSTTATYLVTAGSGSNTLKGVRLAQAGGGGGSGVGITSNVSSINAGGSPNLVKIKRSRAPSPGPVVYYPARDVQRTSPSATILVGSNNNTALGCDWVNAKNGQMTSGF